MDRPSRRRFLQGSLALAGLGLLSGCGAPPPQAQQPAGPPRVGILSLAGSLAGAPYQAFRQGLGELGYAEGLVELEPRWVQRGDELPDLAEDLARREVEVIVAANAELARAAGQATDTIPIVFVEAGDPVGGGLVGSPDWPGGNLTGLANPAPQASAKRLELLKASTPPGASRAAVLWNPASPDTPLDFAATRDAARTLGLGLESLEVRSPDELAGAFQAAANRGARLLVTLGDTLLGLNAAGVVGLAARSRLPTIYSQRLFVEAGGLMTYGPSTVESWRRAAAYVDKILKGAKPADLPVEQPATFDFVINLETARALGLTIPQTVLSQATEVIR